MTSIKKINNLIENSTNEDFASKIVIPKQNNDLFVPEWHKEIVLDRLKNPQPTIDAFEMIDLIERDWKNLK